jgi:hypothetical protein
MYCILYAYFSKDKVACLPFWDMTRLCGTLPYKVTGGGGGRFKTYSCLRMLMCTQSQVCVFLYKPDHGDLNSISHR